MPYYPFLNEKTGVIVDVWFHMNDTKRYVDEQGVEWKRQFTVPQFAIDSITRINPFSKADFDQRADKHCSVGDMMNLSSELSARREEKEGVDSVKQAFYDDYSKKRNGVQHAQQAREEVAKKLKRKGVDLKFRR